MKDPLSRPAPSVRARTLPAVTLAVALAACGPSADGGSGTSAGAGEGTSTSPAAAAQVPTDGLYGRVPAAVGGVPSVVILDAPGATAPPRDGAPHIDQLGLQFTPRTLIAPVGEPMLFRNSESIAHNVTVRSVEGSRTVLTADTPPGDSLLFVIEEPGAYDVTCEIHPGMIAFIYATEAPFATFAEPDGTFAIGGVPPGEYTMRVWSVDEAGRSERSVRVSGGAATEVVVDPGG